MIPTYEQMASWLEEIVAQFPEPFFEGLNGGIQLEQERRREMRFPHSGVYIMGEYRHDILGRSIRLYYGSFARMFSHKDEQGWKDEIFNTVAHEFTHHMEETAGLHGLEDKDKAQMQQIMELEQQYLSRQRQREQERDSDGYTNG